MITNLHPRLKHQYWKPLTNDHDSWLTILPGRRLAALRKPTCQCTWCTLQASNMPHVLRYHFLVTNNANFAASYFLRMLPLHPIQILGSGRPRTCGYRFCSVFTRRSVQTNAQDDFWNDAGILRCSLESMSSIRDFSPTYLDRIIRPSGPDNIGIVLLVFHYRGHRYWKVISCRLSAGWQSHAFASIDQCCKTVISFNLLVQFSRNLRSVLYLWLEELSCARI